jgi:hypothetical protein
MSNAELRNQTRRRDAQEVTAFEVRFTEPSSYLDVLREDHGTLAAVADEIVWLARTSSVASLRDLYAPRWVPGGDREAPDWRRVYVECSYLARGQLNRLACYCGCALRDPDGSDGRTAATAARVLEVERQLQTALSKLKGIRVRGGGALHLHDYDGDWHPAPEDGIEAIETVLCADCQEEIYYANLQWRHKKTGRAEVEIEGPRRGSRTTTRLHHLASPDEEGKQV